MRAKFSHRVAVAIALGGAAWLPAVAQDPAVSRPGAPFTQVRAPFANAPGGNIVLTSATTVETLPETNSPRPMVGSNAPIHLSLDDAKARVLDSSIVMTMTSTQVAAKYHTMQAASKDYLPKLLNSFTYFHFD